MAEPRLSDTGQTLYMDLSVFRCGGADPAKNLTISCSHPATQFKTTLSDRGLQKLKREILCFYDKYVSKRM
jgi:hypothetical protein